MRILFLLHIKDFLTNLTASEGRTFNTHSPPSHQDKMAPVSLLDCPDELIDNIVERLPGSAIKAVRKSCKRLSRIASPYLFPVLYLSCHQLDLDVFEMVSENPLLIGGVRELVIDDTTVPLPETIPDERSYQRIVTLPEHPEDRRAHLKLYPGDTLDPYYMRDEPSKVVPTREGWELFRWTAMWHHDNRLAHADLKALKEALPHFKRLERLVVSNRNANDNFSEGAQSRVSASPVVQKWRRFQAEHDEIAPLAPRCDWQASGLGIRDRSRVNTLDWFAEHLDGIMSNLYYFTLGSEDFFSEMSFVKTEKFEKTEYQYEAPSSELFALIREARVMHLALLVLEEPKLQSQLTEFRVDASHDILVNYCQPGLPITLFDKQSPFVERLATSFALANNITKFRLVLNGCEHQEFAELIIKEGRVSRTLSFMPQLEELYLEPHGMSVFSALPDNMTFPRLRCVHFSCGHLHPDTFVDFLERQGSTLKSLIIEHCSLYPNDGYEDLWLYVIEELTGFHDQGIMELEEAIIDNVLEGTTIDGCGRNGSLKEVGLTWTYDGDAWWPEQYDPGEGEASE
ncbi:hypothetical protein H9Q74_005097 [Fusarium xylarioides]|nr:hypothetical protein H9Q71_004917 [Fusarium xylarioides]KAG5824823.1 hypothetical protein H9Q74_005097 [Fusarium xylarioides]